MEDWDAPVVASQLRIAPERKGCVFRRSWTAIPMIIDRVLKRGAWQSDSNVSVQHRVSVNGFLHADAPLLGDEKAYKRLERAAGTWSTSRLRVASSRLVRREATACSLCQRRKHPRPAPPQAASTTRLSRKSVGSIVVSARIPAHTASQMERLARMNRRQTPSSHAPKPRHQRQ